MRPTKTSQKAALAFLLLISASLIIADIFLYVEDTPNDTFSELGLYYIGQQFPVLWHLIGIILGHMTWPTSWSKWRKQRLLIVAGYALGMLGANIIFGMPDIGPPVCWILLGLPIGMLGWSQKPPKD